MQPEDLQDSSFARYPPAARALARAQLPVLRAMPLPLVPVLLRELITLDWKLPAERRELGRQFTFLSSLSAERSRSVLSPFRAVSLSPPLVASDWVNDPAGFIESLTAWLWSSHQMDRFRDLADAYAEEVNRALPPQTPRQPRLAIVVIGAGAQGRQSRLFRKLRPHGVCLTQVNAQDGLQHILAHVQQRSQTAPSARKIAQDPDFLHWVIDGDDGGFAGESPNLVTVSYAALAQPRAALLGRIEQAINSGTMGPEQLRSLLARLKPADIGLGVEGVQTESKDVLNHFQMSLLTEGAGTQIFATTFVQWATRECIRRAEPETLLVRFTPRQQAQTMNLMLAGATPQGLDPEGSLVDADLGAYYAWLAMRRLSGHEQMRFLVWFEDHHQALAIGPGLPQGTNSDSSLRLDQVLQLIS